MSSIITHETLYEILSKEKTRQELQKIDPGFLKQLSSYLEEKEIILNSQKEKNSFPEEIKNTEKQIRTIRQISNEIIERRKRKILDLALLTSRTETPIKAKNLLENEEALYDSIVSSLMQFSIKEKNEPVSESKVLKNQNLENSNTILIRFVSSVPRFVGTDCKVYGPFIKEDLANLPEKTALVLINKKRAEKIQYENP